ncbi:MAG: ATPase, T2SS/T4P/T4SS family [Elusimicrobiota bacterium]
MSKKMPYKIVRRLGELLLEESIITSEQLDKALVIQKERGGKLGEILIEQGIITEEILLPFLGRQCDVGYVNLDEYKDIDPDIVNIVPESVIRRQLILPIGKINKSLTVAVCDPLNVFTKDDLKLLTGYEINMVIASEKKIREAIESFYVVQKTMDSVLRDMVNEKSLDLEIVEQKDDSEDTKDLELSSDDAPVVNIVNVILETAITSGASDVHIEPFEHTVRVRFRIDGVLHMQPNLPKSIFKAVVSRLKVMASLNISVKRLPQDGQIKVKIAERNVELRISTIPAQFGEKVVLRVLDPKQLCVDLSKLGINHDMLEIFKKNIKKPHGMILITGPTGSGKTTTLYSAIKALNYPDKNILTIEDPIEFNMKGINQVQVKQEIGLGFAQGLRAFFRQDPDIIMVGEIRDRETVEIGVSAALTGHLVFSTIHTNDAVGTITRLRNMGVESFLIASSLLMIVAQRLVRRICPHCKEDYEVPVSMLKDYLIEPQSVNNKKSVKLYRGRGCDECANTGYNGRIGCFEILSLNDEIRKLILQDADADTIRKLAEKSGMETLRNSAVKKALEGLTTIEEVMRITMEE